MFVFGHFRNVVSREIFGRDFLRGSFEGKGGVEVGRGGWITVRQGGVGIVRGEA